MACRPYPSPPETTDQMKITEDRFKSILAGTAPNLTSKEILIRQEAFDAERRGQDPMLAVEAQMPDVTIVRREAYRGTAPPLNVHPENASAKKAVASGIAPGPVSPNSQSLFASIKVYFKLWRRELSRSLRPPVKITASPDTAGSVAARPERGNLSPISVPKQKGTLSSPELVSFSERHGIPLDSFFDAAGMSKADTLAKWKLLARSLPTTSNHVSKQAIQLETAMASAGLRS